MSDQLAVERQGLTKKDKQELRTIVKAMGGKAPMRMSKAALIDEVINLSGQALPEESTSPSREVEESVQVAATVPSENISAEESQEVATKSSEEPAVQRPTVEIAQPGNKSKGDSQAKDDSANSRRQRRRGRKNMDREEAGNNAISDAPEPVEGFLDLRDEGYGFLRVKGFLPSKEDVYVSVKQVRQLGLRKGDHLAGLSTPAHRNEKNPCFHKIETVNGSLAESGVERPFFDEMIPVLPTEPILLESSSGDGSLNSRMIDLFAPLAKGQRGFISSSAKTGRTTLIKDIADAIQTNHPDINLLVLAIDGRPEEITDMYNHLKNGEIVASNFDSPADEHIAMAELTLERAKRLAETGEDVFIIVDGLSHLARAYMVATAQSNRSAATGVDLGALYPIKKILGAAVNLEGSGSLTILSTIAYGGHFSGSEIDASIYEEVGFTANMEIRLSEELAAEGVFPAFNTSHCFVSHENGLRSAEMTAAVQQVKKMVVPCYEEGWVASRRKLIEQLQSSASNKEFLDEIIKKGSL